MITRNSTDEEVKRDTSKSLSIVRSFIRHAVSSIVYHRISSKRQESPSVEQGHHSMANNKDVNDNHHDSNTSSQDDCNNSNSNSNLKSKKIQQNCFIQKSFCGLDNLQFIDAVDDNDSVKDENGKHSYCVLHLYTPSYSSSTLVWNFKK